MRAFAPPRTSDSGVLPHIRASTLLTLAIVLLVILVTIGGLVSQLLGEGTRRSEAFGSLKDIVLAVMIAVAMVRQLQQLLLGSRPLFIAVLGTIGLACLASIRSPSVGAALYGLRNDYEPLVLLIVVPAILQGSPKARSTVRTAVIALGEMAAAIAIGTRFLGLKWLYTVHLLPHPFNASYPGSYFTNGSYLSPRAFSPYPAPNELALASVFVLAVVWTASTKPLRTRTMLSILPTVAIVLSQSRSGLVALAIVVALVAMRQGRGLNRHRLAVSLGVLSCLAALVAAAIALRAVTHASGMLDLSAYGHIGSLKEAAIQVLQNPFGFGTGTAGPRAARFSASPHLVESFFGVIALEAGIATLLAYVLVLAMLLALLLPGALTFGSVADDRFLAAAVLIASLANQFVLPSLQDASISWLLWILVGVGLAARPLPSSTRQRSKP